jgi:hypothetical protein
MRRIGLLLVASLVLLSAVSFAETVTVLQPSDSGYSSTERTALLAGADAVQKVLNEGFPFPRFRLIQQGWTDDAFIQFAAGTLRSAGYSVVLAEGTMSGVARTWILVGIDLGSRTGWIPVEAAASWVSSEYRLGEIAWQGGVAGGSFDSRYLAFSQTVALAPNAPPAITLTEPNRNVIVDVRATFQAVGSDPDGTIIAYQWTFGDRDTLTDTHATVWYAFKDAGEQTVHLVVIDNRGGRTTASVTVDVLAEDPGCGCHQ